ncbi:hypothetical protein BLS_008797 [Venturia inaequalis]|uniref:Uncharacterized protein n=1 Tax=Venturia inaequalis TaxID=5025 RepID=A0A8H3YND8_VENIN|nr:hypothetical protein BLS_008797 [Venturia inaequalis]KAE9994350.1 hypothetical protein EG327_011452 [Venturia inaequalis]
MPRPRRTKVASSDARDVSSPSTLPTSTSITGETEEEMPPKKRGRGRPPKNKVIEESLQTEDESALVEELEDAAPAKTRGRGRPPKNKVMRDLLQTEGNSALVEDVEDTAPAKTRGRGRPPKNKTVRESLQTEDNSALVEEMEDAAPAKTRGRGRPPKNKAIGGSLQTEEDTVLVEEAGGELEDEATPAPKANVRTRGRPIIKKTVASAGQQSALEALKQRRNAAIQAKKAKESPPAPMSNALQRLLRTTSTPRGSDERVTSTPLAKMPIAQREETPSSRLDTEEDLYGLSPGGEASRLRLESKRQSVPYPQSALKAQGTPAVETSILALTNFKRRPRQGSIIRMVQQTSELGDPEEHSDVDIEDDPLLQGLENTLDDFEDFNPEKESTPPDLEKRKSDVRADELRTSSSRKRKHAQDDEEIQVPQSSPPIPSSPPARHRSPSLSSTTASLPEVVESTQKSPEVDIYSETMAPPQSSSEPASPVQSPIRTDKRRKLSGQHQENGDEGSPSPIQAKKQKSRKKVPAISTTTLQSLLPKPRRKARAARDTDEYDIPSSDDDNDVALTLQDTDDDELAHPRARRRAAKTPMRKVSGNRKKVAKTDSPASTRKKTVSAKAKGKEPEKLKVKKTYGRVAVEKENDGSVVISSDHDSDDEGEDTEPVDGRKKRAGSVILSKVSKAHELQEAKKKFAEVDEFEMEFESVDLGGGSSSPWR